MSADGGSSFIGATVRELRALRQQRAAVGLRRALAARGRAGLALDELPATHDRLVAQLERRAVQLTAADARIYGRLDAHQQWLEQLSVRIGEHDRRRAERTLRERDGTQRRTTRADDIAATTAWVEALPPSPTLVSVVMPTHDRPDLLREAIASVLRQSHERFELLVVDDASGPATAAVLAATHDPRVHKLRCATNVGDVAARNRGLDHATGEYVAYLDDDNLMGESWLRAVIWAFEANPAADVAFGALVSDDDWRGDGLPWLALEPWNRRLLPFHNPIDQNMLAHRRRLPGARYDETVKVAGDWDIAVRLTAEKDPVRVPVVAAAYRTTAVGRVSDRPDMRRALAGEQRRWLRRQPLRVVGVRGRQADVRTEQQVETFVDELVRLGARAAWADESGVGWRSQPGPAYEDLDTAVDAFRPDVLVVAEGLDRARLEALQTPFVVLTAAVDAGGSADQSVPEDSFFVGRWSAADPLVSTTADGPLLDELLRQLDRVRARRSGFVDPVGAEPRGG